MRNGIRDRLLFLYKFLRSPRQFGSMTPSSRWLARAIISPLPWNELFNIAELGAGTGAITKYLKAVTTKRTNVILFEKDSDLRRQLHLRFPGYRLYKDCLRLRLALHNSNLEKLDCIVSSLSFRNFSMVGRVQFMEQITASLKEEGLFIAFEYFFPRMKRELQQHFDILSIQYVPLNFPPAIVYICRKKTAANAKQQTGRSLSLVPANNLVFLER
ncbi:class I SAM-dependent methyltransferase [Paenibacillus monticola]|uniref:class I SAM-dependent methyltransferase n=1 Tax=Paenibacillus monticola TaxID=2666075 RepID=UPI00189D18A5|nr:phospholipid methyltransferase [Paenibacillus monticola]